MQVSGRICNMKFINKKIFVIFIIINLFMSGGMAYGKTKNINISKAEQLIKERKFKEAKDILTTEYAINNKDEDYILKLLQKIELEETKINVKTDAAIKSMLNNDNKKAEEFLLDLDSLKGDFNKKITDIIDTSGILNEKLKKINGFYANIGKAENDLINYNMDSAVGNYKNAIDFFRIDAGSLKNKSLVKLINDFNDFEKKIILYDIDGKMSFDSSSDLDYNGIFAEYDKLEKNAVEMIKMEDDFIKLKKDLGGNASDEIKSDVELQAYEFIIEGYMNSLRNGIQKKAGWILENVFKLSSTEIKNMKTTKNYDFTKLKGMSDLLNGKLEYYSFYNPMVNYSANLFLDRTKNNIYRYADYITKKNRLDFEMNSLQLDKSYETSNGYYVQYESKIKERDLKSAESAINKSNSVITDIDAKRDMLDRILEPYKDLENNDVYKDVFSEKKNAEDKVAALETKIKDSMQYVKTTYEQINQLIVAANDRYNSGYNYYKKNDYENAKNQLNDANNKYYDILAKITDKEIEKKVENISKTLKEIDNRLYVDDMKLAEQKIESAKKSFYNEKYDEASSNLGIAENIYQKYDESNDVISYYKERIITAIKLKSGTKLSTDDPVYYHILELFKDANNAYESGKKNNDINEFNTALKYLSQILFEKPYNEDARFLETKILKETDPAAFEQKFQAYFSKAKDILAQARSSKTKKDYGNALLELQQLKVFEKNTAEINSYIAECKGVLEFVPKDLTENDRKNAKDLVVNAKNYYKNGDFQKALYDINQAIKLWEDVPEARNIRLSCMQQLHEKLPELSGENELKFRQAEKAYADNDFETAFRLTSEIMKDKNQNIDKVYQLNKKANIKRQS
jgi:hypothetical protein